jgi:hypothetical protein
MQVYCKENAEVKLILAQAYQDLRFALLVITPFQFIILPLR